MTSSNMGRDDGTGDEGQNSAVVIRIVKNEYPKPYSPGRPWLRWKVPPWLNMSAINTVSNWGSALPICELLLILKADRLRPYLETGVVFFVALAQ